MTVHRSECRNQLIVLLAAESDLAGVLIEHGWPGELKEREMIFAGGTRGRFNVPVFGGAPSAGNPVRYDDEFTLELFWWAGAAGQSFQDADDRGNAIWSVIERVMRVHGFTDGTGWGISDVVIGDVETDVGPTQEGFVFSGKASIDFRIRITGTAP